MYSRFAAFCCLLLAFNNSVFADVLVTIRPLQLLVSELLPDDHRVTVLLDGAESPHDFSLSIHDIARLQSADFVVWVGPGFEAHIAPALEKHVASKNVYALMSSQQHGGHGHEHEVSEAEHVWVGFDNVAHIARDISLRLKLRFPDLAEQINGNLASFLRRLAIEKVSVEDTLRASRSGYFAVYHDGYRPFVDEFGLDQRAFIVRDEHSSFGVAHLMKLRQTLDGASCLVADASELERAAVVAKKLNLSLVESDLLAQKLGPDAGYIDYIKNLAGTFETCLGER